jgi:hypothetical protein
MREKWIIFGASGQILLAIGNIMILVISSSYAGFTQFVNLSSLATAILAISFALIMISMMELYETHGHNGLGEIGALSGLLFALLHSYLCVEAPLGMYYLWGYTYIYISEQFFYPNTLGLIIIFLGYMIYGIALGCVGGFFVAYRRFFSNRVLWIATGMVYAIAGLFSVTLLLTDPTYFLSPVAGIMGAICFIVSKPK